MEDKYNGTIKPTVNRLHQRTKQLTTKIRIPIFHKSHNQNKLKKKICDLPIKDQNCTIMVKETKRAINIEVDFDISTFINYMNQFFRLCLNAQKVFDVKIADILEAYGTCKQTKEITESMSAYNNIRNNIDNINLLDENIVCLIIGDGTRPKTGIVFSVNTKWKILSVDPEMDDRWVNSNNQFTNLTCYKNKIEDILIDILNDNKEMSQLFIINVHSHANLDESWNTIINWRENNKLDVKLLCFSMLCCPKFVQRITSIEPFYEGRDCGVISPQNKVCMWRS